MARKRNLLLLTIALPVIVLLGLIFSLGLSKQLTYAQGGGIYVNKQLGRSNPVVHVGEYLTFTILIRNDTAFTVTRLPLRDNYNASVLGQPDAIPAPDTIDPTGQLDWEDLTTYFGDLAPGQQVMVIVGFIAEHPEPAVVNRAEVHDALNEQGDLIIDEQSTITDTESVGGSAPVEKVLQEGLTPQAGQLLTFTIVITNEGYTTMTLVPLVDTYNPAWLAFSYGDPPPDQIDAARGV
ncbi:MAG: hypothetical protein JW981_02850, partial [Anaerolineae bacterium]|nr:hypothetical protein [Anaerolineae bacterium]